MSDTKSIQVGPTVDHGSYLGGSDIAAVAGIHPYKTALSVWAEKTRRGPAYDSASARSGNRFERVILENYAEDSGEALSFPGTLLHANGITGSTPDAIEADVRDVQVKFVGIDEARRWGVPEFGEEGVPPEVLAQVHWEHWHMSEVLGVRDPLAKVVAQVGTIPRVFTVRIDDEFTSNLLEAGHKWWRDYVIADRVPVVVERDADLMRHMYRHAGKALMPMSPEVERLARDYYEQQQAESRAGKAKAAIAVKLMEAIRDDLGYQGDGIKVTWAEKRGRVKWEELARLRGVTDFEAEEWREKGTRTISVRVAKGDK